MERITGASRYFTRQRFTEGDKADLIPMGVNGEKLRHNGTLPRQRSLLIGINATNNRTAIVFPRACIADQTFEIMASRYLEERFCEDNLVILAGNIFPVGKKREKAIHVIRLFGTMGNYLSILHEVSPSAQNTENFVTNQIAQALLRTLNADRLDVVGNDVALTPQQRLNARATFGNTWITPDTLNDTVGEDIYLKRYNLLPKEAAREQALNGISSLSVRDRLLYGITDVGY